ncbi:MAG: MGMT family protein [Candidatus Micrarchaeota archaeon]
MKGAKGKILASRLTKFQKSVLLETLNIPKGKTISYGELARRIGKPRSARAVGNALGKNPFAPTVPCHRVVAGDGVGGYSGKGGIEGKKRILRREKAKFFDRKV